MTAEERVLRLFPTILSPRTGKFEVRQPYSSDILKAIQEAEAAMKERCETAACRAVRDAAGEHDAPGRLVAAVSEAIRALE